MVARGLTSTMSSNFSINIPSDEARKSIDSDIEAHERSIQELKARRNALAPVLKLPPELLHRIFALVKEDCERYPDFNRTHLPFNAALSALKTWNVVTHVCNRWRQVALNASTLWTKLPIEHKAWTDAMLKRSKTAGLTADLTSETPTTNSSVIKHIGHIKTLNIRYDCASNLYTLLTSALDEAPQLETLSITVNTRHGFAARGDTSRFSLQPTIFRNTKALRRLTLSGVDIKWDSHLFHGLTHLSLKNLSPGCKPTWKQLMEILEQMPDLEVLDLDRAFPTGNHVPSSPLHLANLKELAVYSVFNEVHAFLSHITFPRLKRLFVGCRSTEAGVVDYASVINALSQSSGGGDASENLGVASIRKLELHQRMQATYGFAIEGFSDLNKPNLINTSQSALEFLFGPPLGDDAVDDDTHPDNRVARDVFSRLNFANVTELAITAGLCINARVIADSFGRLPHLGTIRISNSTSREMIRALMVTGGAAAAAVSVREPGDVVFPALHTIVFEWAAFSPHVPSDPRVDELLEMLIQRASYGAPIQRLQFTFCRFLKRIDLARFAEIVPDVQGDEEVGFWSEEDSELTEDSEEDSDLFNAFFGDIDPPFYDDIW